jgi:hypothetical protein
MQTFQSTQHLHASQLPSTLLKGIDHLRFRKTMDSLGIYDPNAERQALSDMDKEDLAIRNTWRYLSKAS